MPYLVAWLLEPRQQDYFLRSYLPFDAFTPLRFVVAFSGFVPPLCFGQKLITPLLTIVGTKDDIVFTDRSESLVTRSFHVDEKSHEGGHAGDCFSMDSHRCRPAYRYHHNFLHLDQFFVERYSQDVAECSRICKMIKPK
jgi:fermentation-respiration switch protein FrsA (DUF1100 family)